MLLVSCLQLLVVADFEKLSAYAFYGESNHLFPPNPHHHCDQSAPSLSAPSDSEDEVQKNASDTETEPKLDNNQEIIELAQRQPSKFQEVLWLVEVRS